MKVYLAEEVRESIATRMLPLEGIEKDFDFAVDMMLHGASAFEIVQCKDCKYYDESLEVCRCSQWDLSRIEYPMVDADGFCSWGVRKGGAE